MVSQKTMKSCKDVQILARVLVSLAFSVLPSRVEGQGFAITHTEGQLDTPVVPYSGKTVTFSVDNQSDPFSHPRFVEYCHLSQNAFSGNEGSSIPGYGLRKVFLLLSPGQRALNINFENITSPSTSCDFETYAKSSNHEKIKNFPEVADIYKHMQSRKSGFKIYQPYSRKRICDDEKLSPLGTAQLILLGEYLGSKYSNFKFHEPSQTVSFVSAYSINNEAAFQSMFAFLHGLLHEKNLVRTYMHKSPYNFCSRMPSQKCVCPKTEYLQDQISKGIRKGFHMFKNTAKLDRNINEKLKIPLHTEIAPREIVSFLSLWICEAKTHPCKNGACLNISLSILEEIFQSANNYLDQITSSDIFQTYAKLITCPFFDRLFQWMKEFQSAKKTVFVGEEEFLIMVMSILGLRTDMVLPQASRLVLEVHEPLDQPAKDLMLKVYFNGMDVSDKLSVSKDLNGFGLSLYSVMRYYQDVIVDGFKNKSYDEECLS